MPSVRFDAWSFIASGRRRRCDHSNDDATLASPGFQRMLSAAAGFRRLPVVSRQS
jgi:hypothetical protein